METLIKRDGGMFPSLTNRSVSTLFDDFLT
jgi:hypothetical protein